MFMRKCRWVRVALVAIWVALPSYVSALGLGEIEVDSALNEKFSATIEVRETGGLQPAEIVVSMASREDFERIGVERFFYLTNLKFAVSMTDRGAEVSVSSSQPIAEPYLNFIVEVLWPNGRLLKEFTVLLDPPTFSQAAAPAVSAPAERVSRANQAQRTPAAPARAPAAQPGTRVSLDANAPRRPPGDGTMTTRDDTLWRIASESLPAGGQVTVDQQMLAIKRLNPEAFIRDNINLLKAGYVLRMPSSQQATELAASDAKSRVSEENEAWRTGRDVAAPGTSAQVASSPSTEATNSGLRSQVDATRSPSAGSEASGDAQGQVRIVANSAELSDGTGSAEADAASGQLMESNETLTREIDELTYQLDREKEIASSQIELKDRQLEVKDQELAALQERLQAVETELENAAQNQDQSTASPGVQDAPWWSSPMVLGGVIGVLVLLLAGALITLRRRRDEDTEYESYAYTPTTGEDTYPAADGEFDETDETRYGPVEPAVGEVASRAAQSDNAFAAEQPVPEPDAQAVAAGQDTQTSDVVGEADIYIAYGRYGQASSLLLGALASDPNRHDVRLKLLEVCVEANDAEQFAEHAQYLVENCDDADVLHACRELEARLDEMADAETEDESGERMETIGDADDPDGDFSLDLEDVALESDDGTALDDETSDGAPAEEAQSEDDFELEFDASDESVEDESVAEDGANLGGDLGIAFDPDAHRADGNSNEADDGSTVPVEPGNDLDFELDLEDLAEVAELEGESDDAILSVSDGSESADEVDEFDLPDSGDADVNATKLDLAEAYIDMGDADGARDILTEVIEEGDSEQQARAKEMLEGLTG